MIGLVWCGECNRRENIKDGCMDTHKVQTTGRQRWTGDKIREGGQEKEGQREGRRYGKVGLGK